MIAMVGTILCIGSKRGGLNLPFEMDLDVRKQKGKEGEKG